MPEGVEVKISAELIRPLVVGKQVVSVSPKATGRYSTQKPEGLKGFMETNTVISPIYVRNVFTKGKLMYWSFSNDWHMLCTFGMTGQWSPSAGKHACIEFTLDSAFVPNTDRVASHVYFNDPRHFGTIKFVNSYAKANLKISSLGWDPLQDSLDDVKINDTTYTGWRPYLNRTIMKSNKPIGQLLMDQSIFAGVGNYIRAEALYQAKMSPWRLGSQFTPKDLEALYEAITSVMKESYDHQGATILTYKDAYGAEGKYSSCFKVYGKSKDPLGNTIKKEDTPDKRTIHWCPAVQI